MEKMRRPNRNKKNGAKNQDGEGGPGLGEHHRRNQGMAGKEAAIKDCLAHRGGRAPAESRRGDKEIAPPWMLRSGAGLTGFLAANSLGKHCVQALRIKADHDFFSNHNGGRRTAVIGTHQLKNRLLVGTNVFHLKLNTFLRKVGLSP